ncbi:hypothetical protein BGX34_006538 [Mortierella sp. NVP85]|nr:hypothetical protein BGX34_006538 [Mortierella sp. NVP85]
MPTLTDKIFPNTIFVVNIVLAIFRLSWSACFAIYAKYGGEHAKSVGWIRSVTDGFGITIYPGTAATKCFFNTEKMDITTIALTSTRFNTGWSDNQFPAEFVRANVVNESDDLLLAMERTVKTTNVMYIPG